MSPSHAGVDVMAEPSHKAVCLTSLSTRWHCAAEFEASCRTVRLSCSVCQETNNIDRISDRIEWHPWLASWTVEIIARKQIIIHPANHHRLLGEYSLLVHMEERMDDMGTELIPEHGGTCHIYPQGWIQGLGSKVMYTHEAPRGYATSYPFEVS